MAELLVYLCAGVVVLGIGAVIEQLSRPKKKDNVIDFTSSRRSDDWYEDGRIKW